MLLFVIHSRNKKKTIKKLISAQVGCGGELRKADIGQDNPNFELVKDESVVYQRDRKEF